jgi:hypothetical protein
MEKRFFNTKELGQYIGRTPQAVRDLACRRKLPYRKFCGRLMFDKSEIDRLINTSSGVLPEEIEGLK